MYKPDPKQPLSIWSQPERVIRAVADFVYRLLMAVFLPDRLIAKPNHEMNNIADKSRQGTPPVRAQSTRRTYLLERHIGRGDLCDVYQTCTPDGEFVVKAPRTENAYSNNLLAKEREVLEQLVEASNGQHYKLYFPQPEESFIDSRLGSKRFNVWRYEPGYYTAVQIRERHRDRLHPRHLAWMFKRVLIALGFAHSAGWINGAVLPPHLMFHAVNHGLHLTGWIHAQREGMPLQTIPASYAAWYPPEATHAATNATDIYLAAKSFIYLSGGDPVSEMFPSQAPKPMQRFIQSCLLESPTMRPTDAWELHDEFSDLLGDLYGPPKYVRLNM